MPGARLSYSKPPAMFHVKSATLPAGLPVAIDGAALPAVGAVTPDLTARCRAVVFVHHPLSQEYGLPPAELGAAEALERRLLPLFRGALCPSQRSAAAVAALGVPADRIAVTPPGTDKPKPPPARHGGPVRRLLYVANIIPRKGHTVLIEALAGLVDLDWKLCCIGALDHDTATVERLRRAIAERGLDARVSLAGAKPPDAVAIAYAAADAFAVRLACCRVLAHQLVAHPRRGHGVGALQGQRPGAVRRRGRLVQDAGDLRRGVIHVTQRDELGGDDEPGDGEGVSPACAPGDDPGGHGLS